MKNEKISNGAINYSIGGTKMVTKEVSNGHELLQSYLNKKVEIKQLNGDMNIGVLSNVKDDFVKLLIGTGDSTKALIVMYQGISSISVLEKS